MNIKVKPPENLGELEEVELMKIFKDSTGRNAIWRGQITKTYLRWKKNQKIEIPKEKLAKSEELSELEESRLMKVFEDTTGRHAIWRGKITKLYLHWKKRQKIITLKEKSISSKPITIISSKGPRKAKPSLSEPIIISPNLSKKKENDIIQFEEIPEFEDVSEFDDIFDLEWTPEIDLDTPKVKSSSSTKTKLLEKTITQALDRIKESFERHCPKCGGKMKRSFVILGPQRRMMVYQCGLCKFYLPR